MAPQQKSGAYTERARPAGREAAREVLLRCTAATIPEESKQELASLLARGIDWDYFLELARAQDVAALVAHHLSAGGLSEHVPEWCRARLSQAYSGTLYRNIVLSAELGKVLAAFDEAGIPVITLKGTVLAEVLYGNPALRSVADMDVLVHAADMPRARRLLAELGYQRLDMPPGWEHPFHENPYYKAGRFPLIIELHWDLDDRRLVTTPEEQIWRRAERLELEGVSTLVLSPEDRLLFLSDHLSKQGNQLLKFLADVAELLRKYEHSLDWDYVMQSAQAWQMATVICWALRHARGLLQAPVPEAALARLGPGGWRRALADFLLGPDWLTPVEGEKLRAWTSTLARGLMMKRLGQTAAVLRRQEGGLKRGAWPRIAMWVTLVLLAAVGRRCTALPERLRRRQAEQP
jgi:hypothetical protein